VSRFYSTFAIVSPYFFIKTVYKTWHLKLISRNVHATDRDFSAYEYIVYYKTMLFFKQLHCYYFYHILKSA